MLYGRLMGTCGSSRVSCFAPECLGQRETHSVENGNWKGLEKYLRV